jgi:predicted PurR-regulated permease PerM
MRQVLLPWPEKAQWQKWSLQLGAILILFYLIWVVRDLLLPLGLAFILATVLDPVVDRMEYRGWKRGPASLFIFISFILIAGGLVVLIMPSLVGQVTKMTDSFHQYFPDTSHSGLVKSFSKLKVSDTVAGLGVRAFEGVQNGILRSSTWLTGYGMSFVSNLIWVVIVPIIAFYGLRDYHLILGKLLLLVPRKRRDSVQVYVAEVSGVFARYLRGLIIVSSLNGLATYLLLLALHVPSALLLGAVAGVLYTVPYMGAILTVVFTGAAAFMGGGVQLMVIALVASTVLHQVVFDQIVAPRIIGGHVGLHPIISIVALLAGNLLLGVVGMILAVPTAACIQISVLALVPKLKAEINLSTETTRPAETSGQIAEETQELQEATDATTDLHTSVAQAVEDVETQLELEDQASAEAEKTAT